jgi:integrase
MIIAKDGVMPRKRLSEEGVRKLKPPLKTDRIKQVPYFDTVYPGLVLWVSYGGTKTWRCMYYVNRKPRSQKLGRYPMLSVKLARKKASEFSYDPHAALKQARAKTFEAVAADFMTRHVEAEGLLTKKEIERRLNKYVLPHWKDRLFEELKRGDVRDLLNRIEDEARMRAVKRASRGSSVVRPGAGQANAVLADIRKIMRWYQSGNDDYVSPIVPGMQRGKPNKGKRVLNDDEIRAVWKAAGDCGMFGAIVKVLLLTAQRRGKIDGMRWDHIVDGVWNIPSESAREKGTAKTIVLPQMALDIINAQPRLAGNPFVFASARRSDGHFNSWSQGKRELDGKLPAGMPPWDIHDLRRTARSLMSDKRARVSRDIAERVLGHVVTGVEGIYDRYDYRDEMADALQRLAQLIDIIVNPPKDNVDYTLARGRRGKKR